MLAGVAERLETGRGYDLTKHPSKGLTALPLGEFDAVIGVGCGHESCLLVKATRHEDCDIPDPKNLPAAEYRAVRDRIASTAKALGATPS